MKQKLYHLDARTQSGKLRRLTAYPIPRHECETMKSKFNEPTKKRITINECKKPDLPVWHY